MALLDSSILIYASKPGHEFLDRWVADRESRVSAISIPEVLGFPSLSSDDEELFDTWFANLFIVDVDQPILRRAAALRRQRKMTLGDAIIAATALVYRLELITRNVDDFKHVADLRLTNPFDSLH